jgi:hypothetical protein
MDMLKPAVANHRKDSLGGEGVTNRRGEIAGVKTYSLYMEAQVLLLVLQAWQIRNGVIHGT